MIGPGGDSGGSAELTEVMPILDSMSQHQQEIRIAESGGELYLETQRVGGGDMIYRLDGENKTLDCTTGDGVDGWARVKIEQGTATQDVLSYSYVAWSEQDNALKIFNSLTMPSDTYCLVGITCVQDAATWLTDGPVRLQRTTEAIAHNGQGATSRLREKSRLILNHRRLDGFEPFVQLTGTTPTTIELSVVSGAAYQLNRQTSPPLDISVDGIYVYGMQGSGISQNLSKLTDLNQLTFDVNGDTLNSGDSVVWTVYENVNYDHDTCKLFVVPGQKYTSDSETIMEAKYSLLSMDIKHRPVAVPIARFAMKRTSSTNNTWTNLLTNSTTIWEGRSISVKTPNYPDNYDNNYHAVMATLSQPGSTACRVRARDFNTEVGWDFIRFRTSGGTSVYSYNGNLVPFTTPNMGMDTVQIYADFDGSVVRSGCWFDRFEYARTVASGAGYISLL